jgi:hypothetical protein
MIQRRKKVFKYKYKFKYKEKYEDIFYRRQGELEINLGKEIENEIIYNECTDIIMVNAR